MNEVNGLYDQQHNYRIGYYCCWNAKVPFSYKGVVVTGVSVGVLLYFLKMGMKYYFPAMKKVIKKIWHYRNRRFLIIFMEVPYLMQSWMLKQAFDLE
ncbi:hypothetical protein [Eubacterium maltosivorans]|uniref:hypothetical protein n=1 Tax=Eubacterium maltosivorans TaxID=2041044 RepID=UPI003A9269FC